MHRPLLICCLCLTRFEIYCNTWHLLCNPPQHTATASQLHCNTLQLYCNSAQTTADILSIMDAVCNILHYTATHCTTLHHTTTHCNILQHTAAYCNTLQHTAPCMHIFPIFTCTHVHPNRHILPCSLPRHRLRHLQPAPLCTLTLSLSLSAISVLDKMTDFGVHFCFISLVFPKLFLRRVV